MYSILVVFNKYNTARVASCWFIIYYRLVMHGNSKIQGLIFVLKLMQKSSHVFCLQTKVQINIALACTLSCDINFTLA